MQAENVNGYLLLSIPIDMLDEAGISAESVIQMSASDGKIVIEVVTDYGSIVCSGDCEQCPVAIDKCDGYCEDCPCYEKCSEEVD